MAKPRVAQEPTGMNPFLVEQLAAILGDRQQPTVSGPLSQTQLKVLALELAAAMPPVAPADESLERRKAWHTANQLSAQLHQMSSVIVLLGDAHRLQHEHQDPVAETLWGNAFAFLSAVAEQASDQMEDVLRGAFTRPPNAFKTQEPT